MIVAMAWLPLVLATDRSLAQQNEPAMPVDLNGPVVARQKYSFTILTPGGVEKVSIPNRTPVSMRLVRPSIDFDQQRIRMTLPISAPDGNAENNKQLEFELPVPTYIQVDFKSAEKQQVEMAKPIKSLTFYRLAAIPFEQPAQPHVISGQLISGSRDDVYRFVTDRDSFEVRLTGRKGLLQGFSILDLKPNECIAYVRGQPGDDDFYASSIEFAPIADPIADDIAGLPRCLFLGDSVSFNYQRPLREALAGKINLYHPPENCGGSTNAQRLHHWIGNDNEPRRAWDVITLNFGLHDEQASREEYQRNLRLAFSRLQETGAQIIWVTSTPIDFGFNGDGKSGVAIPEDQRSSLIFQVDDPVGRVPGRMQLQNQWAAEVLTDFPQVQVCDLWQLVKDGQGDFFASWWFNRNANFDYPEAIPLGRALAKRILAAAGMPETAINPPSVHTVEVPEQYR